MLGYSYTPMKEISFTIPKKVLIKPINESKKWNQNLFLLDSSYKNDLFQFIPREFTITTKNGSSNFNIEMMINFSQTIYLYKRNNPENNQFNLDIADEENVLEKFSQLFQGKTVSFTDDDLLISYKIIRLLKIRNCPNFMKPYDLQTKDDLKSTNYNFQETENEAVLDFSIFDEFLYINFKQTFTIITKKKEYKCNIYAVYSSNVIGEFLKKNPEATSYQYDIEDEFEEFENINKIFNFERVNITSDNVNILDNMIRELEITYLYEMIDNFQNKYDQTNAEINIEQTKIDEIEEIISILHNINETNFDEIGEKINKYIMNKNESEIQEFCSFLIQFIKTEDNIKKQELVLEILINIDKETCKNESIKYLMSQLIKQLLFELGITKSTCSFAYLLYKKGKISKNQLSTCFYRIIKDKYIEAKGYIHPYKMDNASEIDSNIKKKNVKRGPNQEQRIDEDNMISTIYTNICFWFLPEIIQLKLLNIFTITRNAVNKPDLNNGNSIRNSPSIQQQKYEKDANFKYLYTFLSGNNLDVYKQLRDNGEPHDELTKALRRDDVDKLQQILTMNKISQPEKKKIPYNIFEEYIENGETSYINYSAAYGSIKCFKYLLLNNHQIDDKTFKYSIYGGNIEIVKIVDKYTHSLNYFCTTKKNELISFIILSIAKHRKDVFDWIISNTFFNKVTPANALIFKTILIFAVKNSDAHSLIRIFGKGYDMYNDFNDLITFASANGFYKICQLIFLLTKKQTPVLIYHQIDISKDQYEYLIPSLFSENLSIFKLYSIHNIKKELTHYIIEYAISNEYISILKYFFENFTYRYRAASFQPDFLLKCLLMAININNSNNNILSILLKYFQTIYPNIYDNAHLIDNILLKTISIKKIEMTKEIVQSILSKNPTKDFSKLFALSVANNSTDLCHYILDNKLYIDYCNLANYFNIISQANEKTFSIFINNIPPLIKNLFIENNLNVAIENKNIYLIKYLLDQNVKSDYALIEAVKTNDIKIFELVLKYFDPKFINESTQEGTALTIAAEESNLEIVKQLLTIEGIDANLTNSKNQTALNIAIMKQEEEISNIILDFYGENIKYQVSQLNESIKIILKSSSSHSKSPKSFGYWAMPNESPKSFGYWAMPNESPKSFGFSARPNESQKSFGFSARPNESPNSFGFGTRPNEFQTSFGNKMFQTNQNKKLYHKMIPILKRILEVENVDLNCVEGNHSILSFACKYDEQNLVEYLLKTNKVNVNLKDPNEGNTALIVSILNSNYDIAKLLLEYESTDFNIRNYKEETALTISVEKENEEIINKIINSNKFDAARSRLNYAFYISNPKISKLLISIKTLDVNYVSKKPSSHGFFGSNSCSKIVNIACSSRKDEDETVDLIIQHPTFDKEKSLCKQALFISAKNRFKINIFKKLLTLFNEDVNIIDENGSSLLICAVIGNNNELVELILNDPKFDCNKSMIVYAYYKSLNSLLSTKIEKYICEHSQSINFDYIFPDGSTIFTAITYINESTNSITKLDDKINQKLINSAVNSIKFLCENGADPNIPDKQGKYPLEISMDRLKNLTNAISIALIDSNKIDLNVNLNANLNANNDDERKKRKYEYYIHMAASIDDSSILGSILNNKSVDINIPDSDGNSPLMISCKNRLVKNIELFFTRDDLDFLHRNNEGKDALMLMKRNIDIKTEPTQNKEEYLNKLFDCFKPFGTRPNESLKSFNFGARPNESQKSYGFGFGFSLNKK